MPNDVNLDFYFNPPELFKSEYDIKFCNFNNQGSVIAVVTKNNLISMLDFIGKTCVFSIQEFKDNQDNILFLSWSDDSKKIYLTYEDKNKNTLVKIINLHFDNTQSYYQLGKDILLYPNMDFKVNSCCARIMRDNFLNISGPFPKIYDLSTEHFFNFFKVENREKVENENIENKDIFENIEKTHVDYINSICNGLAADEIVIDNINAGSYVFSNESAGNASNFNMNMSSASKMLSYTFIIKETLDMSTYFLFVKEISVFFLLKQRSEALEDKSNFLATKIKEKKITEEQLNLFEFLKQNLIDDLLIIDLYCIPSNVEILQANLDNTKSLILMNTSDRILRLFNYNFDEITLIKEFSDSVNKKKWINAYFYSFKIKSNFQEIIVSALSDVNSLEFIFIDINTGKFIKNMEPFKYQCSDFICHYTNHYSIVLISNKKLFHIYGYFVNHFGALAPQFQYIEENITYIEEEDFFDQFKKNFKNMQNKKKEPNKSAILEALKENRDVDKNMFIYYSPMQLPQDDLLAQESEKDLKELFQNFNDLTEINNFE